MNLQLAFFFVLATAPVVAMTSSVSEGEEPQAPNIVLILADDLGYGDLGSYGQTAIKSPNLDRLAAQGMRFTQHYAGSPVCAPSRCVLLTGLHTGHAYIRDNKGAPGIGQLPLPRNTPNLARFLKDQGYTTVGIGKWGLGSAITSGHPNRQGFDRWFGYLDDWTAHDYYPEELWRNREKVILEGNQGSTKSDYSHDLFTEEAVEFLKTHERKDGPFFLYLAYTIPHVSLQVPDESLRPYRGRWSETPFPGDHYAAHPTPRAAYAGMVSRLDRDVGRIVELLDGRGLSPNTAIFFASDNGPTTRGGADPDFFRSAGPLRGRKGELYEGGIRVPLIVRWTGKVPAGQVSHHVCASWDLPATIAELIGQPGLRGDGVSFAPTLLGKPKEQADHPYLYWEYAQSLQAVRRGRWKLVRRHPQSAPELYDLGLDALRPIPETSNLAKREPKVLREMLALLKTARSTSAEFPFPHSKATIAPPQSSPRRKPRPGSAAPRTKKRVELLPSLPKRDWKLVRVDSESTFNQRLGHLAFDGRPETVWVTRWRTNPAPHPHEIVIDLGRTHRLTRFSYLPRTDMKRGIIRDFEFFVADDPRDMGSPVVSGTFEREQVEQVISFRSVAGRFVRLRSLSCHENQPLSTVAEIGLFTDK